MCWNMVKGKVFLEPWHTSIKKSETVMISVHLPFYDHYKLHEREFSGVTTIACVERVSDNGSQTIVLQFREFIREV